MPARSPGLGVTDIYDLRGSDEVEAHPDVPVPGATWTHLEVKGIPMDSVAALATVADGNEVMRSVYRGFVDHPGGRASFADLLTRLAAAALRSCSTAPPARTAPAGPPRCCSMSPVWPMT